jgi:hypothetical protein
MNPDEPKTLVSEANESLDYLLDELNQHDILPAGYSVRIKNILKILTEAEESLNFYDKHPLWQLMHDALHEVRRRDRQVKNFVIKVNMDPNPGTPALFEFNFFPPGPVEYTPNNFS